MSDADILGGGFPSPPPPPPFYPAPRGRHRTLGTFLLTALALACFAVAAVCGIQVVREATRPPTAAERAAAAAKELAQRWAAWPAGRIFPGSLPYHLDVGGDETATRVGIDSADSCGDGLDSAAMQIAGRYGCRAVLRATYLDGLQGLLVTVGVAVFPDERSARQVHDALPQDEKVSPGVKALALQGSVSAKFNDAARQTSFNWLRGPYVVIAVSGYADGRPAVQGNMAGNVNGLSSVANQVGMAVATPLGTPAQPVCGGKEWQC